jgi:hypothetical protein
VQARTRAVSRSRAASILAVAVPVAVAAGVVALVALVAGAPDDSKDVADPQHLGPRLIVVSIGLLVLVGLELLAFQSQRWWVRALAIPLGLLLALVLVGLLEGATDEPQAGAHPEPLGLGSEDLLIRVAPAAALPIVDNDVVAVSHNGTVEISTLPSGEPRPTERSVRELVGLLDLETAPGLGAGRGAGTERLDEFLAAARRGGAAPARDPNDLVVIVHSGEGPPVEVDIPSLTGEELPGTTVDRLIVAAIKLERLGYRVDLALPERSVDVGGGRSGWAGILDDIARGLGHLRWLVVPVLALMAILLIVGLIRHRGPAGIRAPVPEPAPTPDPEAARAEVAAALDRALDDLPLYGDPRSVIAAAYLRMTAALAEHGVVRRPSDTPLEFLARALEQLDASSAAVHRLTDLLQIAMFSDRPVEATMADEAISAFTQVRDELRSPAWV